MPPSRMSNRLPIAGFRRRRTRRLAGHARGCRRARQLLRQPFEVAGDDQGLCRRLARLPRLLRAPRRPGLPAYDGRGLSGEADRRRPEGRHDRPPPGRHLTGAQGGRPAHADNFVAAAPHQRGHPPLDRQGSNPAGGGHRSERLLDKLPATRVGLRDLALLQQTITRLRPYWTSSRCKQSTSPGRSPPFSINRSMARSRRRTHGHGRDQALS